MLTPIAFPREGAGHDRAAENQEYRSAGELRHLLRTGGKLAGLVPENVCVTLEQLLSSGHCPASLSWLERSILCKLRTMKPEDFSALPDLSEGLENRLHTAAREARSLEELYSLVKSKRYSHARIRRLVMSAFLEIPSGLPELPLYLRILGMTETGARILKTPRPRFPWRCVQSILNVWAAALQIYSGLKPGQTISTPWPFPRLSPVDATIQKS